MLTKPVIMNNTPLVALWCLAQWQLLRDLYGEVLIPQAVYNEFLATERAARQSALKNVPWIRITTLTNPQRMRVYVGLDEGEAAVLALAEERDARLVIIDELRGRRYAQRLGLPLTGTLGVLLTAKNRGLITQISPLLQTLVDEGLYLTPALIHQVRKLAGEL
jgi:hypothetical protein